VRRDPGGELPVTRRALAESAAVGIHRRLDQVFIFDRSIDQRTYEEQQKNLREGLAVAEIEMNDARLDELDVEAVLAFAEHLMTNLACLWTDSHISDRCRLQKAIFPAGLVWTGEGFGTAATSFAFNWLRDISASPDGVASPAGFVPETRTRSVRDECLKSAGGRID
jgi:hypothetical protein